MQLKTMNGEEPISNSKFENYVNNLNSGGQALTSDVRNFYEAAFGYDFKKVKLHTNSMASNRPKV